MITKSQACAAIGFTVAILFSYQMSGDRLRWAVSRSFTENVSGAGSRQSAGLDRSEEQLSSDGTMQGVTLRRTRVYKAQGLQEPKSILWKTQLYTLKPEQSPSLPSWQEDLTSVLVVGDSLIRHSIIYHGALSIITANKEAYFIKNIDDGFTLFVIDLQTGKIKKRFKLLGRGFSAPVVAGDFLFVGASDGGFNAFDCHDWKAKWEIDKKGYKSYGVAPAVTDGVIYFGGARTARDGPNDLTICSVHAVNGLNGTEKWMFTIKGLPKSGFVVDEFIGHPTLIAVGDKAIYFGDDEHHLFAVNAKDGKQIWKFTASGKVGTPAIMDGRVFFSDHGGNLYAVDLKDGKAVWKAAKKNKVATALAAYNKLVYYGGEKNSLYAVDALTGEEKWVYRTEKPCPGPVVANGVIYVACWDNMLLAIDAESGQEKWKYQTPHRPISYPVVGNGVIYYLDEEGIMYALGSS
jgi:outer membrane protein assembly factor BamB